MKRAALLLLMTPLAGCVRTVGSIVTFPVKAAAQGVDWATTSQDEADRNHGRQIRKEEEKRGREARKAKKEAERQRRDDR